LRTRSTVRPGWTSASGSTTTAPAREASKARRYFLLEKNETWDGPASSSGATPSTRSVPSPCTSPPTLAASSASVKEVTAASYFFAAGAACFGAGAACFFGAPPAGG
jgi:hypothetical protein